MWLYTGMASTGIRELKDNFNRGTAAQLIDSDRGEA